jgi:hypothetical protein
MKGAAAPSPPASRPFEFTGCIELREILPEAAARIGEAGREHVRQNFVITRHLREYSSLLARLVA